MVMPRLPRLVRALEVGDRALDAGQALVVAPALVGIGLGERRQLGGALRMRSGPRIANRVSLAANSAIGIEGLAELSLNGLPPSISEGEPAERPVAAADGVLLVADGLGHVDASNTQLSQVGQRQQDILRPRWTRSWPAARSPSSACGPTRSRTIPPGSGRSPGTSPTCPRARPSSRWTATAPTDGCVVKGIQRYEAELKSASTRAEDRQQALKFLTHYVGDIHQPLHVGPPKDKGGNSIEVQLFSRKTNLHAVWDDGMIKRRGMDYQPYARKLEQALKPAEQKAFLAVMDPVAWATSRTARGEVRLRRREGERDQERRHARRRLREQATRRSWTSSSPRRGCGSRRCSTRSTTRRRDCPSRRRRTATAAASAPAERRQARGSPQRSSSAAGTARSTTARLQGREEHQAGQPGRVRRGPGGEAVARGVPAVIIAASESAI